MADAESVYGVGADDEVVSVVSYGEREESRETSGVVLGELHTAAENIQRLCVTRLQRQHVLGRMHVAPLTERRPLTDEKLFHVPRFLRWTGGRPDVILDELRRGRVRARVEAAPGTGKTVRLAPLIASELSLRVCLVGHDANLLRAVTAYAEREGLGRYKGEWSRKPGPWLVALTYADFNGIVASQDRRVFFRDFDVFIFDEAGLGDAEVFVAKRNFAAYSLEGNSLLLCSATISVDEQNHDGSAGMGNFSTVSKRVSVAEAIASRKLVTDYLKDKTLVLVPGDQAVWQLVEHYRAEGVDVRGLDSASERCDDEMVVAWLSGDSCSPRVVVAHEWYGLGHNFPVEFVISWPERQDWTFVGGVFDQVVSAQSRDMVLQHMSRAGRGIAQASGGMVMSPVLAEPVELYREHRMRAFVLLHACYIRPLRRGQWEDCYAVFPNGLDPATALAVLKVALPVEVTVRYLASDGQVAAAFVQGLTAFAQPDHYLYPSTEKYPHGYESWRTEAMGGYDGGEASEEYGTVRVPFEARGEMRVVLHALDQVSRGKMLVRRWRPPAISNVFREADLSSDEEPVRRFDRLLLRRIEDRPAELPPEPEPKALEWQYESSLVNVPRQSRRRARFIDEPAVQRALAQLDSLLDDYKVPDVAEALPEVRGDTGEAVKLVTAEGQVESPGGTTVCEIPVQICGKLNSGVSLTADEYLLMLSRARSDLDRFVASKLFSCLAGPWESILQTLLDDVVVQALVMQGAAPDSYNLVGKMLSRFRTEVVSVMRNSNVFKKRFRSIFGRKVTMDELMTQIRRGAFHQVAQSDGFIRRVMYLKDLIDQVLLFAERYSVYLPTHVTEAQRGLPIRGPARLGVVGEDLVRSPFKSFPHDTEMRLRRRLDGRDNGRYSWLPQ